MKDTISFEKFNNCLTIDIKCSQNLWHVLIGKLNYEILQKKAIIKFFYFELKKSSDFEGIVLNILTHFNEVADLKLSVTKFLNLFKLNEEDIKYSIQDNYDWDLVDDFYKCLIAKKLSGLICKLFSRETIDTDSLLSFSLIIHLGWINSRVLVDDETIDNVLLKGYHLNLKDNHESHSYNSNIRMIFNENKNFIFNILKCFKPKAKRHQRSFLDWKVKWGLYCLNKKKYINRISLTFPVYKEMTAYRIPFLINKQLGLNPEEVLMQNSLITFALNDQKLLADLILKINK